MNRMFLALVFAVLAMPALARTNKDCVVPPDAEFVAPHSSKALTSDEQAKLGLHVYILPEAMEMYNEHREEGTDCFVYEKIPAGTKVWRENESKKIRYKMSCVNRLGVKRQCPKCPDPILGGTARNAFSGSGNGGNGPGLWKTLTNGLESMASGLWDLIRPLLSLLVGILLLILLGLLLWWLFREIRRRNAPPAPVAPQQVVPPPAAAPAPQAPIAPVQPVVGAPAPPQAQVNATQPQPMAPGSFSFTAGDGVRPNWIRWGENIREWHASEIPGGGNEVRFYTR